MELDGFASIPQVSISQPQVAKGIPFPAPVTKLTCNGKTLFMELDSFAGIAQISIGKPQVVKVCSFPVAVANLVIND